MSDTCDAENCPGPRDVPLGPFLICRLHADSGCCFVGADEYARPLLRIDLGRCRYSLSSRQGRLIRAIVASVAGRRTPLRI